MGGVAWFTLSALNQATHYLILGNTQVEGLNTLTKGANQSMNAAIRLNQVVTLMQSGKLADVDATLTQAVNEIQNSAASLEAFKAMPHPQVEQGTVDAALQSWKNVLDQGLQPMMSALQDKKFAEYRRIFRDDFHPLNETFISSVNRYQTVAADNHTIQTIDQLVGWCKNIMIVALLIGAVILVPTDRYLVGYVIKPLTAIRHHFRTLTEGKLQKNMETFGRNDAGQLVPYLSEMQDSLKTTVLTIRGSADAIYTGTSEITAGNNDLSSRTEQQAAALQQTAASMEQLGTTLKHNTDNVHQATRLSDKATGVARQGWEMGKELGAMMDSIIEAIGQVNALMGEIATATDEQSQGIHQVSIAINEIDGVTQQNAALVEQSAAAAASLEEQARQLTQAVAIFQVESTAPDNRLSFESSSSTFIPRLAAAS